MSKVLYIAGYGRSGSTVLAAVLGTHPEIASVGEVCFLPDDWADAARTCSCGEPYRDCEQWGRLQAHDLADPDFRRSLRRVEGIRGYARLLLDRVAPADRETYAAFQRRLFDHVRAHTGKPIVLDSSKSAWLSVGRALALHRLAEEDVYVLHLVRDGRATLRSLLLTGSNWQLEGHRGAAALPGMRAVTGWLCANLAASVLRRRLGEQRYLRLRYEDFLADPRKFLERVGRFVGVETTRIGDNVARETEFVVGHMVGGNRVRLAGRVTVRRGTVSSREGDLGWSHRLLFTILGGWLNVRYGYRSR